MFRIRIDPAGREPFMEDANEDGQSVEPLAKGRRADSLKAVPHGSAALIQMAEYTGDLIGLCDPGGRLA